MQTVLLLLVLSFCSSGALSTEFNVSLAEEMVAYSRAAYCNNTLLQTWTCLKCNGLVAGFVPTVVTQPNSQQVQAFVGRNPSTNSIVVAFRGTQDLKNWIEDLSFLHIDSNFTSAGCDDCRIHRGFYDDYLVVHDEIVPAVTELVLQYPGSVVYVTGHSLGAALAAHCALDLAVNHGLPNVVSLTFGQPRVGNQKFAEYFGTRLPGRFRVVHNDDIVPHLPPTHLGFWHEPTEVWNTGDATETKVCDGSGEDQSCSASVGLLSWSIEDHLHYLGMHTGCRDYSVQ